MRYHAFMSHAQMDASGTANTLFFAYESFGLHNWIDMRQEDLTLQGMRQGVCDSDVFLVILSEKVLSSWFCQQELLCAIENKKKIQIVQVCRREVWGSDCCRGDVPCQGPGLFASCAVLHLRCPVCLPCSLMVRVTAGG